MLTGLWKDRIDLKFICVPVARDTWITPQKAFQMVSVVKYYACQQKLIAGLYDS